MNTVNKKKKRSYRLLISNILLITAVVMLNYPLISDIVNAGHTEKMYSEYMSTVSESEDEIEEITKQIDEYNASLVNNDGRFLTEKTSEAYADILNIQSSIMCYIDVPTGGVVHMPVYHYASAESLQAGCGHIAGSSLPSDGENVHMAISAHSGMSGQKGFSGLGSVKEGDTFTVSYLNKVLTYKVFRVKVVEPDDMSLLEIEPGGNVCSLITCTPIGLNTHRLVVSGYFLSEKEVETNGVHTSSSTDIVHRFNVYELSMSGVSLILMFILIKDLVTYLKKRRGIYDIEFIYLDEDDDLINPAEVFRKAVEAYYT